MSSRIVVATIVSVALGCALVFAQPQPSTFFKNRIGLSDSVTDIITEPSVGKPRPCLNAS